MAPGLRRAVLLLTVAGLYFCDGALNTCRNVPGFELPGDNSYISYDYTVDSGTGDCNGVTRKCSGSVSMLEQRSWFINPIKNQFGTRYRDRSLEIYKIQCPAGNILHLFPQELNVQLVGSDCTANDFITVERGQEADVILCGTNIATNELYNFGRGVLVPEGNATITFCTDGNMDDLGFVIRGTCIDPQRTDVAGCTDFQFFFDWDANFTDVSGVTFAPPVQSVLTRIHKRSVSKPLPVPYHVLMKRLDMVNSLLMQQYMKPTNSRQKRFIFEVINLVAGQSATYVNNLLIIDFNDGTTRMFLVSNLDVANNLIGTRNYKESAPGRVFNGPARVEVNEQKATIQQTGTIDINSVLLLPPLAAVIGNNIADYIWTNYLRPYPIIDETNFDFGAFPLTDANNDTGNFVRFSDILLVRETVNGGTCRRAVNLESTPARGSEIDEHLSRWCKFFFFACNPYLAALCEQVDKLTVIPRI